MSASVGHDQADAARALTRSGDAVDIVIGPAGHGKSTMLDAARAAWRRLHRHGRVITADNARPPRRQERGLDLTPDHTR